MVYSKECTWSVFSGRERSSWDDRADEVISVALVLMERMNSLNKEGFREQNPCSDMLVIPSESVVIFSCSKDLAIDLNVAEKCRVLGCPVQPSCSPQKLILVSGIRAVERADEALQTIAVRSSVLISKLEHLDPGVRRIDPPEDQRSSSKCSSGFASNV